MKPLNKKEIAEKGKAFIAERAKNKKVETVEKCIITEDGSIFDTSKVEYARSHVRNLVRNKEEDGSPIFEGIIYVATSEGATAYDLSASEAYDNLKKADLEKGRQAEQEKARPQVRTGGTEEEAEEVALADMSVKDLKALCEEEDLDKADWGKLKKDELVEYLTNYAKEAIGKDEEKVEEDVPAEETEEAKAEEAAAEGDAKEEKAEESEEAPEEAPAETPAKEEAPKEAAKPKAKPKAKAKGKGKGKAKK